MLDPDALARELAFLRRGRATRHPDLPRRVGPQLRVLCGITAQDRAPEVRGKIRDTVESLLLGESQRSRLAALAAFGLHHGADQRDLAARERWLAGQLSCQHRTARRRVQEAMAILVQRAVQRQPSGDGAADRDGWRIQAVRALLRLDGAHPELTERRTILATRDGLDEIVTRFSLPRVPADGSRRHDLVTEVLHGGRLRQRDHPAAEHFRYVIELPHPLREGDTHDYVIRFAVPAGQVMAPHYVLQPLLPCLSLDLTIRFDPARPPGAVWRLDGVPPRMVDAGPAGQDMLAINPGGQLHLRFRHLRQGFAYGAAWVAAG